MSAGELEGAAERRYVERMRGMQFKVTGDSEVFRRRHCMASRLNGQSAMPNVKRIMQELSTISTSLPLTLHSSVFVVVDTSSTQLVKALISGPKGTPYECGLYEFDIMFPQNYPNSPPSVLLVTTGGGRFRFNPNLYSNGKVCLSLLGTWSGNAGESWNAKLSTLLQVLISIQALILVDEPYFNEPGYERQIGTPQGKASSRSYNTNVRKENVKLAVIDQIEKALKGETEFADVIVGHFAEKGEYFLGVAEEWQKDTGIEQGDMDKMAKLFAECRNKKQ